MVKLERKLITLMEVARIAGQNRSTVGNWKDRIEGFPPPRDKGARGPLYDQAEIVAWLSDIGRLPNTNADAGNSWDDVDRLRAQDPRGMDVENLILVFCLRSVMSTKDWSALVDSEPHDLEKCLTDAVAKHLPFALSMLHRSPLSIDKVRKYIEIAGEKSPKETVSTAKSFIHLLASGLDGGKENLPSSIVSLVVGLAGKGRVVLDPAAHTGQLLAAMGKASDLPSVRLVGQEQNDGARNVALLNMKIQRLEASISADNAITYDKWPDLRADVIVSNPPWGQRLFDVDQLANDARWVWGAPGPGDGNMAWVQHCLFHLSDQGRAVIVLPSKVLFEQGRSARIRQGIIKAGYLESVIALPPGLLETTKVGFVVLVFAKGPRLIDGGPNATLMVNLEEERTELLGRQKRLPPKLIEEVVSLHQQVVTGLPPAKPYAAIASYDAIAENGFDITPKRYVMSKTTMPTPVQFDDALKSAREALRRSLEDGRQADRQLEQLLRSQR